MLGRHVKTEKALPLPEELINLFPKFSKYLIETFPDVRVVSSRKNKMVSFWNLNLYDFISNSPIGSQFSVDREGRLIYNGVIPDYPKTGALTLSYNPKYGRIGGHRDIPFP